MCIVIGPISAALQLTSPVGKLYPHRISHSDLHAHNLSCHRTTVTGAALRTRCTANNNTALETSTCLLRLLQLHCNRAVRHGELQEAGEALVQQAAPQAQAWGSAPESEPQGV